ncbi:MAG: phosphotransferase [Oscillospiraceae bacterium]|nr:phosphotransferase [Oscillospiraceae bacterium]
MKDATILRIAGKCVDFASPAPTVARMRHEDGPGVYDAWKICDGERRYLLKRCGAVERGIYEALAGRVDCLPICYGVARAYGKDHLLLEFVEGRDLMRGERAGLTLALDAIVRMQDAFWGSDEAIGTPFGSALAAAEKRREHLPEKELRQAYDRFLELYASVPRTLCHDDLLPFNLIVDGRRAVLIDWEHGGILPYPASVARLIAHTRPDPDWLFYLSEEDRTFALEIYYERLIRHKGIAREDYRRTMEAFLFYEATEWVYVYRRAGLREDARYRDALERSRALAARLLGEERER